MKRRSFFASAAAAVGSVSLMTPKAEAQVREAGLRITGVELWRYTGDARRYNDYLAEGYPKGGWPVPETESSAPTGTYMRITTDGGVEGFYGPLSSRTLMNDVSSARSIIGENPLAIEAINDVTLGAGSNGGDINSGAAAIINTLWDLKGKICNAPVYQVLGGNRKTINCYATTFRMPHALDSLDNLAEAAARVKNMGFNAQKWFPEAGPAQGAAGLEFNVNIVRTIREACGDYYDIMIDGLNRWDLPYAESWCKRVERYYPRWLEEPLVRAHQVQSLSRLRQVTSIPIATGESDGNRWDFLNLVQKNAVDVMQPEPERMGTSEIIKICTLAGIHGLMVSPHHNRINALSHIVGSQTAEVCPIVEYRQNNFLTSTYFERNPIGHNGKGQVELSDRPGYGLELDESKIVSTEKLYPTT